MFIGETLYRCAVPDEFMNCKKAHEVRATSEVVNGLAKYCKVKQVRMKKEKRKSNIKHFSSLMFYFCLS